MSDAGYGQLLGVQDTDTRIDQVRHRQTHHPIGAEVAALRAEHEARRAEHDELEAAHHDLERQRKRIDDEVAGIRARHDEIEAKLYDGSVTATKELLAMQEESARLVDRQHAAEDDELELMEQLEDLETRLAQQSERLGAAAVALEQGEARLAEALAELDVELAALITERDAAAAVVAEAVLTHYESLRTELGGVAVARLVGNQCTGCHLSLSAVESDRIKRLPPDALVACDSCGRILIR